MADGCRSTGSPRRSISGDVAHDILPVVIPKSIAAKPDVAGAFLCQTVRYRRNGFLLTPRRAWVRPGQYPHGPRLEVYRRADSVYADVTFDERHIGAPGLAHGGRSPPPVMTCWASRCGSPARLR